MRKSMVRWIATTIGLLCFGVASAQTLVVPNQVGILNSPGQTFVVNFTPGPDSGAFDFVLNAVPAAALTFTAVAGNIPNGTSTCSNTASSVTCIVNANNSATDLAAGTITVTYTAGPVIGPVALNFGATNFFNQVGGTEPGVATNGVLTIANVAGPPLSYSPTPTTAVTVGASSTGTAITATIVATPIGGALGQSTTLVCTIAGAGFAAPVVTGSPFATGGAAGSIGLACGTTATTGTLACVETTSGSGGTVTNHTWPLTCATAPGFNSVPAPGGTLSISGIAGTTAPGGVAITNPGTGALNITGAAVTGAGFTLGTVSNPIAAGGSGTVNVSCAVPATAGTTIAGTLTFNTNATPATANYTLSCTSLSASIPTLGWAGKALMALLMLAFGWVGFQLHRRAA